MNEQPVYPTWIRTTRIRLFWLLALAIVVVAAVVAIFWLPGLALAALALPFVYIAVVISLSSWRLSPRGDDLQAKIHQQVIARVGPGGRLLDVGCGSGQLVITFAKSLPGEYVGLDFWPDEWGQYAESQAKRNASLEGVPRIEFIHGSASRLPFEDCSFERVVSCLTFHEVKDVEDKTASLGAAIRVLRPGGRFAFIDLFDDPAAFRGRDRVIEAITNAGGTITATTRLADVVELKWPMNTGKALGYAVIIAGTRTS